MRIVFVAGGTGGHIYPGIAVAQKIKGKYPGTGILFIGSEEGMEKEIVPRYGFALKLIKSRALLRKVSYKALSAPFVCAFGFFQALFILRAFHPDRVFSTGGYASFAVVIAAKILGIPIFIHEQNALPGMTNRFCSKFARQFFLSFTESLKFVPGKVTGNPVREEILRVDRIECRKRLNIPEGKLMLLVMGGSQGAHTINKTIFSSLPQIDGEKYAVFHLIGKKEFSLVDNPELQNYPFYHPLCYEHAVSLLLAAADMVISRAGASALAEFAARGLPMLLVPFPFSAEGHQDLNAKIFTSAGAAITLHNRDFNLENLGLALKNISSNYLRMSEASRKLARPLAAETIAAELLGEK